jgi:hypothetical protein
MMRVVVGGAAVLCIVAGLAVIGLGGPYGLSGLWLVVLGGAGLVAVAFERSRYRSEQAERDGQGPGIGGIDEGPVDPRFRPTNERFVDPTTHQRVRVWVDASTGERRYRLDE